MDNKEELFKEIFENNKDRIYRICCSYVRSQQNRDDLFQEIFTNIWNSLNSFKGASHINTWIYRISINTSINYCRLQSRNDRRCTEIKKEIFSDNETSLQNKLKLEKELHLMFDAINTLPVLERSIISLVLEGVEHSEIASIFGISEVNVRVKFHRTKKKLKKIMEEKQNGF